ncbi:MAG: hypothetical protein ACLP8A_02425 [Methylovirgula sp.]
MAFQAVDRTSRAGTLKQPGARSCGSCTACCDGWLQIEISGQKVAPGAPCPHSSGHSCNIYADRPNDPCRQFICGWLAAKSPLPEWMRPDQASMILLPAQTRWRDLPVDVAVPVGDAPKTKALAWLKSFCEARRRPLLYQIAGEWFAFGPDAFQQEMSALIARGEPLWR